MKVIGDRMSLAWRTVNAIGRRMKVMDGAPRTDEKRLEAVASDRLDVPCADARRSLVLGLREKRGANGSGGVNVDVSDATAKPGGVGHSELHTPEVFNALPVPPE